MQSLDHPHCHDGTPPRVKDLIDDLASIIREFREDDASEDVAKTAGSLITIGVSLLIEELGPQMAAVATHLRVMDGARYVFDVDA